MDDWSSLVGLNLPTKCGNGRLGRDHAGQGLRLSKVSDTADEWAEINGSEGSLPSTAAAHAQSNHARQKTGSDLTVVDVPAEFLKPASVSPRSTNGWRTRHASSSYDLMWEFVSAIVEAAATPSRASTTVSAQVIAHSVLESHAQKTWVEIPDEPK